MEGRKAAVTLNSRVDGDESVNICAGECAFRNATHVITHTDYVGYGITRNGIQANDSAMLLHGVGEFEGDMRFDPKLDTVVKHTAGRSVQTGFILHTEEYGIVAGENQMEIRI